MVLPQPFSPTINRISPGAILRLTGPRVNGSLPGTAGKRYCTLRSSRRSSTGAGPGSALSSKCGSGEEKRSARSAIRRKAICARLMIGNVPIRLSSGPFMYSSTSTKPLITAGSLLGHSDCSARTRPMTTKNSIVPKLLAITKMLIERTWVSRMWSAVPSMLRLSMACRRGR
ncbi:hypothetical protein D3C84_933700 [compost metagenome]